MRLTFFLCFFNLFALPTWAQIKLQNPSFEGFPNESESPVGWSACRNGASPDVLPGVWGVEKKAADGTSYAGLITREDGTYEDMTQKLSQPLKANECYTMTVKLARSKGYVGFRMPVRLRVWGGQTACERQQLLASTKLIKNTDWQTYELALKTKEMCNFIIFEAYYGAGTRRAYRGNLLLDDCSDIDPCRRAMLRTSKKPTNLRRY